MCANLSEGTSAHCASRLLISLLDAFVLLRSQLPLRTMKLSTKPLKRLVKLLFSYMLPGQVCWHRFTERCAAVLILFSLHVV
jgi:hypothetical protein